MKGSKEMAMNDRLRIPIIAALATFALHLLGNPHYGYFRDELYFIVCGQHPQWGYVDQPPVAPLLAAGSQIFGHSLVLLRAIPAFFAAAAAYVSCLLAAELGGGAFAQVLAALVVFFAPVLMNFGMKVSPDTIGLWLWPLAALYTLRLTKGGNPRGWMWVGVIVGICLQSKYSVVFFFAALLLGLLLTSERRILFSRWFLAGCAICGLSALPNFLWQAYYGFPMLELLRNGQHGKNLIVGPGQYLLQELLITNVFLSLVWIIGLGWLLWKARLRFLGYTYIILIAFMVLLHGKHYYPADVYPYLMAAGAVAIEVWTNRWKVLRPVVATAVIGLGLVFVPFALPILPEEMVISYKEMTLRALHIRSQTLATEHQRLPALPTDWADMHGWPELAAVVGNVYQSLPPGDRAQAVIVAQNYGEASAIDFFGKGYGLPPVISGHNQYYLWGTHGYSGNVIIDVAGDCGARAHLFDSSERAATFTSQWAMPYEDGIPIMVCRGIHTPLTELWPRLKSFE
jgi:4-amino-4-deoxy-L-arabinose transferase-like glycosyltransferase